MVCQLQVHNIVFWVVQFVWLDVKEDILKDLLKKRTRTYPSGALNIELFPALTKALFHMLFWAIILLKARAHANRTVELCQFAHTCIWKMYVKFWHMLLTWNGLLGLRNVGRTPANKTTGLSSVFTCFYCIIISWPNTYGAWKTYELFSCMCERSPLSIGAWFNL